MEYIQQDALEYLTSLPAESVDFLFTDPPYDFNEELKLKLHTQFQRVSKGSILVFGPPENQWVFPEITKYLFWIKPSSTKNFTRSYGRFVEMLFLYQRGTYNGKLQWSNYTGVYDDRVVGLSDHPYEKPQALIERFIHIHTNPGDIVLDPFCGSGIIPNTAERLGRVGIGVDLVNFKLKDRKL